MKKLADALSNNIYFIILLILPTMFLLNYIELLGATLLILLNITVILLIVYNVNEKDSA